MKFFVLALLLAAVFFGCGGNGGDSDSAKQQEPSRENPPAEKPPAEKPPEEKPPEGKPPEGKPPEEKPPEEITQVPETDLFCNELIYDPDNEQQSICLPYKTPSFYDCSISGDDRFSIGVNHETFDCFRAEDSFVTHRMITTKDKDGSRYWRDNAIKVFIPKIIEGANFTLQDGCPVVGSVQPDWDITFTLDASAKSECKIILKRPGEPDVVYTLQIVYGINDAEDLKIDFFATQAKNFALLQDINLQEYTNYSTAIVPSFRGSLDGQGYSIYNISIDAGKTEESSGVGFIGSVDLKEDDPEMDIRSLNLRFKKLVGYRGVGGLIGTAASEGPKIFVYALSVFFDDLELDCHKQCGGLIGYADKVSMNTTTFQGSVEINCYEECGGLIGHAKELSMHKTSVKGSLTVKNFHSNFGGIVGHLESFTSHDNLSTDLEVNVYAADNVEYAEYIGLIAGKCSGLFQKATNKGSITLYNNARDVGGICGAGGQASSVFSDITIQSGVENLKLMRAGGLFGKSDMASSKSVLSKFSLNWQGDATAVGGLVGLSLADSSIEKAIVKSRIAIDGTADAIGGLTGKISNGTTLEMNNIGSITSYTGKNPIIFGKIVGALGSSALLYTNNCYARTFNHADEQDTSQVVFSFLNVGENGSAIIQNCYTPKGKFVRDEDLSAVSFNNVYAAVPQTGSDSVAVKELLPDFGVSDLNVGAAESWIGEYEGQTSEYPMLVYPEADIDKDFINKAAWFGFQIEDN